MATTLNIAVIGAGTMAQAVHLPVMRRRWDLFAVSALVDHSPRRRREASEVWGVPEEKRFETVADLVTAMRAKSVTVDAVLLSTDGLHVDDLLQLLRRGVPVLVEPPLGYSADEVRKITDFERMIGRRLVMMAYPQQYDEALTDMGERIPKRDLRMVDYEVLMPASQPLYGAAHVTPSAYDLPPELRTERRHQLQEAVEAGSGEGATQRDRDLYVKGLLTGVAHQVAALRAVYGPIEQVVAVRHWPKGVIPGSIEILAEFEGGAPLRLMWHYLPFAAEYSERIQVLSARRRMRVEIQAPSHGDRRSHLAVREKKSGVLTEDGMTAAMSSAEGMWEAFHRFVTKAEAPLAGPADELDMVTLLRGVLASIVEADGRTIDPEPEPEAEVEAEGGSEGEASKDADDAAKGVAEAETAGEDVPAGTLGATTVGTAALADPATMSVTTAEDAEAGVAEDEKAEAHEAETETAETAAEEKAEEKAEEESVALPQDEGNAWEAPAEGAKGSDEPEQTRSN